MLKFSGGFTEGFCDIIIMFQFIYKELKKNKGVWVGSGSTMCRGVGAFREQGSEERTMDHEADWRCRL